VQIYALYRNSLKKREFDKEAPQNFCQERETIAERQGSSDDKNSEGKPTPSKTAFSSCFGTDQNALVSALHAEKRKDYICPECSFPVRVKGGKHRQSHFFHVESNPTCRQAQKGPIHLRLQSFIKYLLADEGAVMEKNFSEIHRIADVACMNTKKVFEIQYSPMPLEEAKQRCRDYETLGYQVIWILHDHYYNQKKIRPPEPYLRKKTCYFSNMDEEGNGMIYDQLEEISGKRRRLKSDSVRVNLRKSHPSPPFLRHLYLQNRTGPLYHEGDLVDSFLKKDPSFYYLEQTIKRNFVTRLQEAYFIVLYKLLERSSR